MAAGISDANKIGVMGTSMGGITAAGIMATQPTVVAGVSLIGSPEPVAFATDQVAQLPAALQAKLPAELIEQTYQQLAKFDLSEHPEALAGRPMFFFNGTADQMVPYQYIRDFKHRFKDEPALKATVFKRAEGGVHHVPHKIQEAAVAFLETNILK